MEKSGDSKKDDEFPGVGSTAEGHEEMETGDTEKLIRLHNTKQSRWGLMV